MLTREEQARREREELAARRYERTCRLNEAENRAAVSDAHLDELARLRAQREADLRRERAAAAERKRVADQAARAAERQRLAAAVALVAQYAVAAGKDQTGRQARGERVQYRAFDENGQLYQDDRGDA